MVDKPKGFFKFCNFREVPLCAVVNQVIVFSFIFVLKMLFEKDVEKGFSQGPATVISE